MASIIKGVYSLVRNLLLNSVGVEREFIQLINDRDIGKVQSLMQNRDEIVNESICEYDPLKHKVTKRMDKDRLGDDPYFSEKLPRARQRYINEVELFFLLGNPIKWKLSTNEGNDDAFQEFNNFLRDIRFNTVLRQAKRLAGAETESAILFHVYRDDVTFTPSVKALVLSYSKGYTLRPLFDQYGNLLAFGYGYNLRENNKTIQHFDIQTASTIYRTKKTSIGWEVDANPNPTGKINIIYIQQDKAWNGLQSRIDREEDIDSKVADTNNYFADPIAAATADVVDKLSGPDIPGRLIQYIGADSKFEYINPPIASELQANEKKDLNASILFDTFTPDLSFENMKGMGTLSGEAMKRAMALGYMKRDNLKEIYDIAVDRAKNVILAIMMNVTHIGIKSKLAVLNIEHEFAEPFNEDVTARWTAIAKMYSEKVISLEQAVKMLGVAENPEEEVLRIKNDIQISNPLTKIDENSSIKAPVE